MHQVFILIFKADYMEILLNSVNHIDKADHYNFLHPWLGTGLLTSTGNKWRSRRKLLTPAFHFKILEDFIEIINEQSDILVQRLNGLVGKDSFDLYPYITLCTLDIICDTAMGRHVNAQKNADSNYVKALYKIEEIIQCRQLTPWLQIDWIFKLTNYSKEHDECLRILHGFTNKVIRERKAEREAIIQSTDDVGLTTTKTKKRLVFLDLLLHVSDNGKVLSDEDIREEVDTFMFEGHDTTSAGITWTLYLLGRHPEIQEKIYEEIESVLGPENRQITSEDLRDMKYLECAIKESLRLYPPVPLFGRKLKESITLGKYNLPPGVTILSMLYLLHRDEDVFPDPDKFNPDRFLTENCLGRHPFSYIPFSAGPRNCIGQRFAMMEQKIVIAKVLKSFQVETLQPTKDLKILNELIIRSKDGITTKLKPRKLD